MAYRDFTFPQVITDLGLTVDERPLFADVPPDDVPAEFAALIRDGVRIGTAINTEKARSELIVAPIIFHVLRTSERAFGLFSGVTFDVDPARGLNGVCDFMLTRVPRQFILTAPIIALAEAKNDNVRTGFGQCIASLVAAREFNLRAGTASAPMYGVATNGEDWQFFKLVGDTLSIDVSAYMIADLPKLVGVLRFCIADASR